MKMTGTAPIAAHIGDVQGANVTIVGWATMHDEVAGDGVYAVVVDAKTGRFELRDYDELVAVDPAEMWRRAAGR